MAGSTPIVFREILEAAVIIAVVMAATRGIADRGRWVGVGILIGLAGAPIVAVFAGGVPGRGFELLNAGILLAAMVMLARCNIWMCSHGCEIATEVRKVGRTTEVGAMPLSALALVSLLMVLREGVEALLFIQGQVAAGAGWLPILGGGGVLGLAGGAVLGWLLYRGLIAIPVGKSMSAVGWMFLLLAAGLAAKAAGYLNQAGLLPEMHPRLWDTSTLLSQHSWLGMLLHALVGYIDRPMGIQLLFYVTTLVVIYGLMRLTGATDGYAVRRPQHQTNGS